MSTEQPAVYFGMQRLHAAIHHFRKAGVVGDVADFDSCFFEMLARAASAKNFDATCNEFAHEFDEAGFVADTDESTFDRRVHRKNFGVRNLDCGIVAGAVMG